MNKAQAIMYDMSDEEVRAEEEAHRKLLEQRSKIEQELLEKIPAELVKLFVEYIIVQEKLLTIESEDEYANGFERGLMLMADNACNAAK